MSLSSKINDVANEVVKSVASEKASGRRYRRCLVLTRYALVPLLVLKNSLDLVFVAHYFLPLVCPR